MDLGECGDRRGICIGRNFGESAFSARHRHTARGAHRAFDTRWPRQRQRSRPDPSCDRWRENLLHGTCRRSAVALAGLRQRRRNGHFARTISANLSDISFCRRLVVALGRNSSRRPGHALLLVELPGGTPRRLDDFEAQDAAWSRDGKQLVYGIGAGLYLASSDGSNARKLATADRTVFWPRISPSGRLIRFNAGFFKEDSKLWEVRADGTGLRELAAEVPDACCGDWSPDGKEFYFQGSAGALSSIWALPAGSSEPVQLTSGPLSFRSPAVSPDGKKIFVVGEEQRGQLMKYDAKTGQFAPFLEGISPDWVAFSRDGQWLAYTTLQDGILWRERVDGSDKLQLTFPPMQATMVYWSPGGTKVAFSAARQETRGTSWS